VPDREFEETEHKTAAMRRAIQMATSQREPTQVLVAGRSG
jgi:hypothetical protein